jgi:hypothetical protein
MKLTYVKCFYVQVLEAPASDGCIFFFHVYTLFAAPPLPPTPPPGRNYSTLWLSDFVEEKP